jgi:25S rRNA (uracil2843-N3)-methyltransferase
MPPTKPGKPRNKKAPQQQQSRKPNNNKREPQKNKRREELENESENNKEGIDLSSDAISSDVQQVLLNIFKHALSTTMFDSSEGKEVKEGDEDKDDLNKQIQTLKTHLYNRDFDAAFADASPALLRAYALRWSASRCLAYAGLFRGVLSSLFLSLSLSGNGEGGEELGVLCIGGGAGAEIVALAGAWRVIQDTELVREKDERPEPVEGEEEEESENVGIGRLSLNKKQKTKLAITAVDIAEWSDVIHRLDKGIHSADIPGFKTCASPLMPIYTGIDVSFRHLDILSLSEAELKDLLSHSSSLSSIERKEKRKTSLISLMFTLNELFSTSIPKTTQLLLRLTDLSSPGTILLVVDSPGSYSTLSFSNAESSSSDKQQSSGRQYPMKFLLDHTLLTVAEGKWEKIVSQDSRWFRRDANSRLHYNVDLEGGQGFIKLEDMRFQIHVYRRLDSSDNTSKN